ncbi:oligopeptide transporter [Cantharellus anzutake]|uniref:oligopeptide transporter n=1 Tax=Cantharellus anzutake TaxID=1750568 RepID=UPI001906BADA|nr:oligopeptide transporter [Cantharellus anzutake]KAF8342899.1 oligopeptide transporter [Cantharellus anzutake]
MADIQDVHHRQPYNSSPEDARELEKAHALSEKGGNIETPDSEDNDTTEPSSDVHGITPGDPFPENPLIPHEEHTLTIRALVVGIVLGAIVGASNIYLGLKTGFTFGPQLFGAIFGFAILKPLAKIIGGIGPGWLTGSKNFGPKENVTVQSAATAAGGIGIIFVGAVPAMYRLGLLSRLPEQDTGKLIALTVCVAYYGAFFVIPLRKYYILKQKLVFPTPTATAYTIRQLHSVGGAVTASKKAKMLGYSFLAAFLFKVLATYAPGLIWDWHIGWTMYRIGFTSMIALDNYGWWIEFTPAFYGAGMLSGMNASWSFFMGAVLAWGIIAPSTIATGVAVGINLGVDNRWSYLSLHLNDIEKYSKTPSPRYWLLWPGVLIMIVYSFVEVGISSRHAFYKMFVSMRSGFGRMFRDFVNRNDPNYIREIEDDDDPAPPEDRVPLWAWFGGLILSVILTCSIVATKWNMGVGEAILALVFGFLFSFLAVQSAGDTDINPVSTVAKANQLVFGGVAKGQHLGKVSGQTLNLVAGVLSGGAAAQSSDMTGDLKTGHLLRAKPRDQFVAQLAGATVAIFLNVGLFILFTKSASCILYPPEDGVCSYGAPSVSAWAAVAAAVLAKTLPIPPSSGYTAIALSVVAALTVYAKHFYIPRKYWVYVPNWNAIGLAFVVPQVYYPLIMAVGATINWLWERKSPSSFDLYGFPLAAGLVAGEGIGGVMSAILAVAGVDGGTYGTAIGCPSMQFCG